jgi:hypothetical protein
MQFDDLGQAEVPHLREPLVQLGILG